MPATLIEDEKLTNEQAAKYIGIESQTLSNWRATKRQQIPYLKIGRLVRYRKRDLDAYLASCAKDTVPTAAD